MRRLAFRSIVLFNVATALWLSVMFLILRHPGYALNAALTVGIATFCAFAFFAARTGAASWMRASGLAGSFVLGAGGAWAIYQNLQPTAHFEGFILIVGATWILQAVAAALTLAVPTALLAG